MNCFVFNSAKCWKYTEHIQKYSRTNTEFLQNGENYINASNLHQNMQMFSANDHISPYLPENVRISDQMFIY